MIVRYLERVSLGHYLDRPESYFWLSYERFYTFCFHRRAWMSSVLWLYLKNARLDDAPRSTVVAVQLLRQVSRIGILVLALWLMGFSPPQIWRQLLVTLAGRPAMAPTP